MKRRDRLGRRHRESLHPTDTQELGKRALEKAVGRGPQSSDPHPRCGPALAEGSF
ncbi:MAG: hypothetical protein M3O15_03175 [Acidobacteriota bacterium]|nr:hypothetical protein [Acidobacteriota bacterium]